MKSKFSSKLLSMLYKCYLFAVDEDFSNEVKDKFSKFDVKIRKKLRQYKINNFLFEEQIENYWL